jgi:hypothetical protein
MSKNHPIPHPPYTLKVRTDLKAGKPLGDQVADFTHITGLDQLAGLYTQITGKNCGCKQRQEWLNRMFPG